MFETAFHIALSLTALATIAGTKRAWARGWIVLFASAALALGTIAHVPPRGWWVLASVGVMLLASAGALTGIALVGKQMTGERWQRVARLPMVRAFFIRR